MVFDAVLVFVHLYHTWILPLNVVSNNVKLVACPFHIIWPVSLTVSKSLLIFGLLSNSLVFRASFQSPCSSTFRPPNLCVPPTPLPLDCNFICLPFSIVFSPPVFVSVFHYLLPRIPPFLSSFLISVRWRLFLSLPAIIFPPFLLANFLFRFLYLFLTSFLWSLPYSLSVDTPLDQ